MKIHGTGCCLIDSIYMGCNYANEAFSSLWSKQRGDGGLIEGGLVFTEDLEQYTGKTHTSILHDITHGRTADKVNVGGPAVVALVHAAQILKKEKVQVTFYGVIGEDEQANKTYSILENTPLTTKFKVLDNKPTPTTEVFDDPSQRNGKGERSFINTIGAAWDFSSNDLSPEFYDADIILLGGTALVPHLHDEMDFVLKKAKQHGCFTIVGTVYDFRHEKISPEKAWPLGNRPSYPFIDLLVCDEKEALRLTNTSTVEKASKIFTQNGLGAFIITRGALPMIVWSDGSGIEPFPLGFFPVSAYMDAQMEADPSIRKDTTGCGDNFLGGVLVAIAKEWKDNRKNRPNMREICAWGASSGGFTCTYHGGTFHETYPGEKEKLLEPVVEAYLKDVQK